MPMRTPCSALALTGAARRSPPHRTCEVGRARAHGAFLNQTCIRERHILAGVTHEGRAQPCHALTRAGRYDPSVSAATAIGAIRAATRPGPSTAAGPLHARVILGATRRIYRVCCRPADDNSCHRLAHEDTRP